MLKLELPCISFSLLLNRITYLLGIFGFHLFSMLLSQFRSSPLDSKCHHIFSSLHDPLQITTITSQSIFGFRKYSSWERLRNKNYQTLAIKLITNKWQLCANWMKTMRFEMCWNLLVRVCVCNTSCYANFNKIHT